MVTNPQTNRGKHSLTCFSAENLSEFTDCLSRINAIVEEQQVGSSYILGDFNSHPNELFGNELHSFCVEQKWMCADVNMLGTESGTYTFVSEAHGCKRWLDHCVVTESAFQSINSVNVKYDVTWSDHFPLFVYCNLNVISPNLIPMNNCNSKSNQILWGNRHLQQLTLYHEISNGYLKLIDFPDDFRNCCDMNCDKLEHRLVIDKLYNSLIMSLSSAAIASFDGPPCKRQGGYIKGWNRHVSGAHREARLSFLLWASAGKPSDGELYNNMVKTRNVFKSKLKWCQDHQDQITMDQIASHHNKSNFRDFWKCTKNINRATVLPVSVDGLSDAADISNMFKDMFVIDSPLGPPPSSGEVEFSTAPSIPKNLTIRFTAKEVKNAIGQMKRGKSPGHDGLSVEHLRHAGKHLPRVLALLYNFCVSHSYLPSDMMKTVVVPIIKNKTGDMSDKSNYRPISLATIVAKVFDSLLNTFLQKNITLHDAQHGFRKGLSTETAILCLKKTVSYYVDNQSPVLSCFLDMSKAFDMVNYDKLWGKLRKANMPEELIKILRYWYGHQVNCVRWAEANSDEYRLECGVRQGGLTSPILFNLYIDGLISELSSLQAGCYIDGVAFNNISYADDMALLSPSVSGLRRLLDVCERYVEEHGLRYNAKKSEVLIFGAKSSESFPPIKLAGNILNRVQQFKYLGHIVTAGIKDDLDVERERRALAVRCNMLVRRFARCTCEVKVTLFKAYCQTFYTCSLWTSCTQKAINVLRVQYNNAFRMLLGLPRFCSASGMFADAHTDGFAAIRRKRAASLLQRVRGSSNSLLNVIAGKFDCPLVHYLSNLHVY